MEPAEILLNHYDMLGESEPVFRPISPPQERPMFSVAIYRGVPEKDALVGFTIGLSLTHPPGGPPGIQKELMVAMRTTDEAWPLAAAFIAYQLKDKCPFECGDTINFVENISTESEMNAFVIIHPILLEPEACEIDLGVRRVSLIQLLPIYQSEREWFLSGGDLQSFLQSFTIGELMEPSRRRHMS